MQGCLISKSNVEVINWCFIEVQGLRRAYQMLLGTWKMFCVF